MPRAPRALHPLCTGDILENVQLVEDLERSKSLSEDIREKDTTARATEEVCVTG